MLQLWWTPDGWQIASRGDEPERNPILIMDPDGTRVRELPDRAPAEFPDWLEDAGEVYSICTRRIFSDPSSGWRSKADEIAQAGYQDGEYQLALTKKGYVTWSIIGFGIIG